MRTEVHFTWEYLLDGHCAAEFDCEATCNVNLYGDAAEVEGWQDLKVDVLIPAPGPAGGGVVRRMIREQRDPDDFLRGKIMDWLNAGNLDQEAIDAAWDAKNDDV
ncbi:MAG: hypothetical protein ACK4RK_21790 [Gemmataceae bacterium]